MSYTDASSTNPVQEVHNDATPSTTRPTPRAVHASTPPARSRSPLPVPECLLCTECHAPWARSICSVQIKEVKLLSPSRATGSTPIDATDNARTIRMASPKIRASRPSTRQTTTVLAKAISKRRRRRETRKRIRTCTIPALYPACGAATPPVGPTGMMVTARVADSGLAQRRSPFKRAAGEENVGANVPFY